MSDTSGLKTTVIERFDERVSSSFQRQTLRVVLDGYRDAYRRSSELSEPEAYDLIPHWRRALIEDQWRSKAVKEPGLTGEAEINSAGNSYHTVVRSGDGLVWTASAVPGPQCVVRSAEFREGYAEITQFDFFQASDAPAEGIYALLIHGSDKVLSEEPSFVRVAFPDRRCEEYVAQIDLLSRYIEEGAEIGVEEDRVPDDLGLEPRTETEQDHA